MYFLSYLLCNKHCYNNENNTGHREVDAESEGKAENAKVQLNRFSKAKADTVGKPGQKIYPVGNISYKSSDNNAGKKHKCVKQ